MSDNNNNLPGPVAFEKFLENQNRELAVKEKEIDLEREKNLASERADVRQVEFAKEQLASIERDRKNFLDYRTSLDKKSLILGLFLIVCVSLLLAAAVWKDKDQMIIEIVKAFAYAIPSGAGGYAWGRYKKKNDEALPPR
jgi:hypothetical protein